MVLFTSGGFWGAFQFQGQPQFWTCSWMVVVWVAFYRIHDTESKFYWPGMQRAIWLFGHIRRVFASVTQRKILPYVWESVFWNQRCLSKAVYNRIWEPAVQEEKGTHSHWTCLDSNQPFQWVSGWINMWLVFKRATFEQLVVVKIYHCIFLPMQWIEWWFIFLPNYTSFSTFITLFFNCTFHYLIMSGLLYCENSFREEITFCAIPWYVIGVRS